MGELIIKGQKYPIDLEVTTWEDDKRLQLSREDGRPRKTRWVRMQINHTTKGIPGGPKSHIPQKLIPGAGPNQGKEFGVAKFWATSAKSAGAHTVIDLDSSVGQLADLFSTCVYHARSANEFSVGHEIYQLNDGSIYEATINACALMNLEVSKALGIQFQIHRPYLKRPFRRLELGGADCVGIFGHHDQTYNRGAGDPGEFIKDALVGLGAEVFNFDIDEDKAVWKERQEMLGLLPDGIPGPQTTAALKEAGYRHGLWALGKREDDEPEEDKENFLKHVMCAALGC